MTKKQVTLADQAQKIADSVRLRFETAEQVLEELLEIKEGLGL